MIYSLDAITKTYNSRTGVVRSLDNFSLEVGVGKQLALIGRSGAGKTTLFRLLNATLRPTSGKLLFEGRDIGSMSASDLRTMRRQIGTVYQQHHLVPSLSVLENTLCGRLGHWSLLRTIRSVVRPTGPDTELAMHHLESVGLAEKWRARADELSGGQQQRLAIARVLMQDADVILADEPVASLDPGMAETITSLLVRLATELPRRTLIVTLHAVELALDHFPRIVAMDAGRLAFDLPTPDVSRDELRRLFRNELESEREEEQFDVARAGRDWCAR